jgi:AraC-like DNA-binding protein
MAEKIPYYNNLSESFQSADMQVLNPDFELIKFEDIPYDSKLFKQPFRLNAFIAALVTDGSFSLNINSQVYHLERGNMYFTAPWHIRHYHEIKNWKGYIIFFTPQYVFQQKPARTITTEFPFYQAESGLITKLNEEQISTFEHLFTDMQGVLRSDNPDRYKMLFHYTNILLFNAKAATSGSYTVTKGNETVVSQFMNLLNGYFIELNKGNIKEELTLKAVAEGMHLHPNYLSNLLKDQTGKSASQIIRERVGLEAQALLKNTNMTVAEVAYYLQFTDTSNFAKFFKNVTGFSPSGFRESLKEHV